MSSSSTELVNEDPDECRSLQKTLIKTTKKSNYGSLRKDITQTQTASAFIVNYRHTLKPGETLQGISLRYGVPVESIKRANRLWSNDLAIIKDVLFVPMSREKLVELNLNDGENETAGTSNSTNGDINNNSKVHNQNGATSIQADSVNGENKDGDNEHKFKDYLNKYDTFISESKLKLKSLETNPK
jgi:LysM repeat protein